MFQYTPYTGPLLVIAGLGCFVTYYSWRGLEGTEAVTVTATGLMASFTLWTLLAAVTLTVVPLWLKVLAFSLLGLSMLSVDAFWFLFAAQYAGRDDLLNRGIVGAIGTVMLYWVVLSATGWGREFLFADLGLDATRSFVAFEYRFGTGGWITLGFGLVVFFGGAYLMFQKIRRSRNVYRKIAFANLACALGVLVTVTASVAGLSPFPHFVLTPFLFGTIALVALVLVARPAVLRHLPLERWFSRFSSRFGDLVPLARDVVVREIDSGVIVLDGDDRVVDINRTGRRILGIDGGAVGRGLAEVGTDVDLLDPDRLDADGELEGAWVETADGRRYYELSVTEVESGGNTGRVLMLHDATDRRRREEELDLLKDVMGRFLRHNIRNELNVVRGHLSKMERELPEQDDRIELLVETTDRVVERSSKTRTLEQVIEHGNETVVVDIVDVLADVLADARSAYPDVEFTYDGPASASVRCSHHIEAAIENVLENAVEHNDAARPRVEVAVEEDTRWVSLTVSDNGPGISTQEVEVLERGEETPLEHGSGFGLWLINLVVGNSGGDLSFSTDGDGTTVQIRLRRSHDRAADADAAAGGH